MQITKRHLPPNCYSKWNMKFTDGIVIHYISAVNIDADNKFDEELVYNIFKDYKVSAHYLINRDGKVIELVPPIKQAWHAGASKFDGKKHCNSFMFGIELMGTQESGFTDDQYESLTELCRQMQLDYDIPKNHIVGHSLVATPKNRKQDPGTLFDWDRLMEQLK